MDRNKDKIITLRPSSNDIYMANYVFYNNMANQVRTCPDMLDALVEKLRNEVVDSYSNGKINKLLSQYERLKKDNLFKISDTDIAGTKLSAGKPYNVFINSKAISDLQNYIIKNTEVKKPHSSWIIQLAILNAFLPLAKRLGDYDIEADDSISGKGISEIEKIDLIEKVVKLFKNAKQNANKIKQIREILEKE